MSVLGGATVAPAPMYKPPRVNPAGEHAHDRAPTMVPLPRDPDPVEEPLYSSHRGYLEQLDHYKNFQGKA